MKKLITILAFLLIAFPASASPTLWHYYTENGEKLPSIEERSKIYINIANDEYRGSYEQNLALLDYLQNGIKEPEEKTPYFDLFTIYQTFGIPPVSTNNLIGGNVPASAINWRLASAHTSSQTTIDVVDFEDLRDNDISTSSMPTKIYFVIEPENTSNTEIVMCLAANGDETNTQFTSCVRGLSFSGTSETAVTANQKSHPAGAYVIMSNPGQFFNNFVDIDSAQTIGGVKTFSSFPITPSEDPTTSYQVTNKQYVDNVTNQGAATSTETVAGIGQISTAAEQAGNTFDATAPAFLSTKYASSTSANNYVVVSESDGKLNQGWLDLTEDFTFSGENTLSNATTTISGNLYNDTNITTLTASTTITGGTTPQPVYIATGTGALQLCDANNNTTFYKFFGFAVSSGSNGDDIYVQYDGIVDGFSGLTVGSDYYVQDAVGTIGTSIGTVPLKIGQAISTTEIVINREKVLNEETAMSDNTDVFLYADAFVTCEGAATNGDTITGYLNGTAILYDASKEGSCADCGSAISFWADRGDTIKCDAATTFDGGYYYYN